MTTKYRLQSDANVYTPGIVKWAMSGYWSETDQQALRDVIVTKYSLPDDVAHDLLTGKIKYTVDTDDAVVFEVDDAGHN